MNEIMRLGLIFFWFLVFSLLTTIENQRILREVIEVRILVEERC